MSYEMLLIHEPSGHSALYDDFGNLIQAKLAPESIQAFKADPLAVSTWTPGLVEQLPPWPANVALRECAVYWRRG